MTTAGVKLTEMQESLCEQSQWDFSDLRALFINCTLKRSPEQSRTRRGSPRSRWRSCAARA